jgi:hypothetical protein
MVKMFKRWMNQIAYERAKLALERQRHEFRTTPAREVEMQNGGSGSCVGHLLDAAGPVREGIPELCERPVDYSQW